MTSPYYTYFGSLTTPPCTEGIDWFVNIRPYDISVETVALFQRVMDDNSRTIQQRSESEKKDSIPLKSFGSSSSVCSPLLLFIALAVGYVS